VADRRAISLALERAVERAVGEIAVNATANLIATTPVDTGCARANWVPSIGAPHAGVVGAEGAPDTSAQRAGLADVLRFKLADGKAFVSNNVPYIGRLNAGSSTQAPAAFVEAAVAQAVAEAKR